MCCRKTTTKYSTDGRTRSAGGAKFPSASEGQIVAKTIPAQRAIGAFSWRNGWTVAIGVDLGAGVHSPGQPHSSRFFGGSDAVLWVGLESDRHDGNAGECLNGEEKPKKRGR